MRVLGAILAGGRSRRFGSDKAAALFAGKKLFDHVADTLKPQVDAVVVAGRDWPELLRVDDLPEPGLGPLGGLAGALEHAWRHDFEAVLSCGCDIVGIPADLASQLEPAPAIVDDLPIVALWPVEAFEALLKWLGKPENRSVYRFADHIGARRVSLATPLHNINHPDDLE